MKILIFLLPFYYIRLSFLSVSNRVGAPLTLGDLATIRALASTTLTVNSYNLDKVEN